MLRIEHDFGKEEVMDMVNQDLSRIGYVFDTDGLVYDGIVIYNLRKIEENKK